MNNICPLCDKKEINIIGEPSLNQTSEKIIGLNKYNVVQCTNCYVYYVLPIIPFTKKEWAMLYSCEYFADQSNWLSRKRSQELSYRFDKAENYLPDSNISFLDIGCGEGKALIEGVNRGWDVTGIDIVDNRINDAKETNIKFITAEFLQHKYFKNKFDFIYLDSVLEHVINPKEYLIQIYEILKVGGVIYIGVPNEDSLLNDFKKNLYTLIGKNNHSVKIKPFTSPYHVIGFNEKSLSYIIKETNLRILFIRNFGRKFNFLSFIPSKRGFWINLFLLPILFIGAGFNKDVYYEVFITKKKLQKSGES